MGGLCSIFEKYYLNKVRMDGYALEYVPDEMKTFEICLAAVKKDGCALRWVPEHMRTPEMCLLAVRSDGDAVPWVPDQLKTYELYLEAVQTFGLALLYVPEHLQSDEIIEAAIQTYPGAVHFIKKKLIIHTKESKQMPQNAYDTLQLGYDEETAIRDGELMVDFHDEFKYGRFYRKKTFEDLILPSKTNGYTKEPITEYTVYQAVV